MSLFQKLPQTENSIQYYTLGQNKTVLVAGLGNPEKQYDGTRHNIGFACVDAFAVEHEFPGWIDKKDLKCQLTHKTLGDTRVIVIKPTTFMNLSGQAVQAVMHFYKVAPEYLMVVHDELDIPFGQIRIRTGGSSAGHNGLKSIMNLLGEDFGRIRVGVGPKQPEQMDSADFVLAPFNKEQQTHVRALTRETTSIITEAIFAHQLTPETRSFIV